MEEGIIRQAIQRGQLTGSNRFVEEVAKKIGRRVNSESREGQKKIENKSVPPFKKLTVLTKVVKYAIKDRLERLLITLHIDGCRFFCRILFILCISSQFFYGAAIRIRLALYSSGLFKAREIGCKVVSVGNITVGGTGKTPTGEFIARRLNERGVKAAILSRGTKEKVRV